MDNTRFYVPITKGTMISHYKIIEKIGAGGMGEVYLAEDTELDRKVALKFLPPHLCQDEDCRKRFKREAQAAAKLDHPNIIHVYEVSEFKGRPYFAMQHVEGQSLRDLMKGKELTLDRIIDLTIQICEGLSKAHQAGIIHRDIKPSNIVIDVDGRPKLLDFGLAAVKGAEQLTRVGTTVGTASYMSPEQASGDPVDHRTDIWSTGVVLSEMLTGKLPFKGDSEQAVIYSILNVDPEPLTSLRKDVPEEIEQVVNKALEKEPDKRFQSISDLKNSLNLLVQDKELVKPPAVSHIDSKVRARRFNPRKLIFPVSVLTVIFLMMLLISFGLDFLGSKFGFEKLPPGKSLVVLPFTNIGDDPENQVFCEGVLEILTSGLTQLERFDRSLWIVSSSEVRAKGVDSPGKALQAFGANLIISGSMQRFNGDFSMTMNLIETSTMRQLRAKVINDQMSNVSLFQDGIIVQSAEMLDIEISPENRRTLAAGATSVQEAHEYYIKGLAYLRQYEKIEDLDNSISFFRKAVDLDSRYARAFAGLGEAYWRKYSLSKDTKWVDYAINNCNRALELNDLHAHVYVTLGLIQKGTGEYLKAVETFKKALELEPGHGTATRLMAAAYRRLEMYNEAELTYKKAIEQKPDYWRGYNSLGAYYFKLGRYKDAAENFRRVIDLNPMVAKALRNLGACYIALNQVRDAIEMFDRSLKIEENYVAYSNLGTMYFYEEEFKKSAQMYEKALKINNKDYRVWGGLASALYCITDERERSRETYERAITVAEENRKINPKSLMLLSALAEYNSAIGNRSRALTLLQELTDLNPEELEVMFNMGDSYEMLGEREKALEWIGRALEGGYSIDIIEKAKGLEELRNDDKFKLILQRLKSN